MKIFGAVNRPMNDYEDMGHTDDHVAYRPPKEIGAYELRTALTQLQLFGDDPYLRMQAYNLVLTN